MTKARKAPLNKNKPRGNRGAKIAGIMFIVLSALVALSMVVAGASGQQTPKAVVPVVTSAPTAMPAATP